MSHKTSASGDKPKAVPTMIHPSVAPPKAFQSRQQPLTSRGSRNRMCSVPPKKP